MILSHEAVLLMIGFAAAAAAAVAAVAEDGASSAEAVRALAEARMAGLSERVAVVDVRGGPDRAYVTVAAGTEDGRPVRVVAAWDGAGRPVLCAAGEGAALPDEWEDVEAGGAVTIVCGNGGGGPVSLLTAGRNLVRSAP